jgi:hypothetical protein
LRSCGLRPVYLGIRRCFLRALGIYVGPRQHLSSRNHLLIHVRATDVVTPPSRFRPRATPPSSGPCVASSPLHTPNCLGHQSSRSRPKRTIRTDSSKSAKMPSEVSDIKQFIEICRRKDAKCTSTTQFRGGRMSQEEEILMGQLRTAEDCE